MAKKLDAIKIYEIAEAGNTGPSFFHNTLYNWKWCFS